MSKATMPKGMTTKEALRDLNDAIPDDFWGNNPQCEEALAHLTAMAEEFEKVKAERDYWEGRSNQHKREIAVLKAELARYRPLIEAVEKANPIALKMQIEEGTIGANAILRAALARPAPLDEEVSCSRCGGSGYARGGEEEQIECRVCSGSGIVLRQPASPPASCGQGPQYDVAPPFVPSVTHPIAPVPPTCPLCNGLGQVNAVPNPAPPTGAGLVFHAWRDKVVCKICGRTAEEIAGPPAPPAPTDEETLGLAKEALRRLVEFKPFWRKFDHCGAMNATQLGERDLFLAHMKKAKEVLSRPARRAGRVV